MRILDNSTSCALLTLIIWITTISLCHRLFEIIIEIRCTNYCLPCFPQATKLNEKPNTSLALEHFDTFYKPMYGEMWPSIRVALLSQQKYCALVNNYSDHEKSCSRLAGLGARNIINTAHHTGVNKLSQTNKPETDEFQGSWREPVLEDEHWNLQDRDATKAIFENVSFQTSECDISNRELKHTEDDLIDPLSLNPDTNLSEFMPVDKVYSEKEVLKMAEVQQSMFEPRDIQVSTVTPTPTALPQELRVYAFNKGDVSAFPAPKLDSTNLMGECAYCLFVYSFWLSSFF